MSRRRPPRATSRANFRLPHRGATAYRRLLARHPSVHWLVVGALAVATGSELVARDDRVEQARRAWGDSRVVLVADRDTAPGEQLVASAREVPAAIVPASAVDATGEANARDGTVRVARQHVGAGEIVTDADVAAAGGPLPLLPPGWLAVPVVESPSSGATVGDRVLLASDGIVLARDALVVGRVGDVTLVGVPADGAPSLPPAAASGSLAVLRQP